MKVITASFPGVCADCRGPIAAGQKITGGRGQGYAHYNCDTPDSVPAMENPDAPATDGQIRLLRDSFHVTDGLEGLTKGQAGLKIDRLIAAERQARASKADELAGPDVVPAGRYAYEVTSSTGSGSNGSLRVITDTVLVRVWRGSRNPKYVRCYLIDSETQIDTASTLRAIVNAGPANSAKLYGQLRGRCYRCDLPLKDLISVDLGMGPVCAKYLYSKDTLTDMKAAARERIRARGLDPNAPAADQLSIELEEASA